MLTELTTEEKLDWVKELTQRLYQEHREIRPIFPWVLVLVLQRDQRRNGLYLPENQNKTTLEGVVLSTWTPWVKTTGTVRQDGATLTKAVQMQSNMELGDHVLFEHWAGLPIPGYDEKNFRLVKELEWERNKEGGIYAKVDYGPVAQGSRQELIKLLIHSFGFESGEEGCRLMADKILSQFVVVDRESKAVTLSGK